MSNYTADNEWTSIWDALYWSFINRHKSLIKKNPRLAIQVKYYNNKSADEKREYSHIKNNVIKSLL